jgi:hypothetical protein
MRLLDSTLHFAVWVALVFTPCLVLSSNLLDRSQRRDALQNLVGQYFRESNLPKLIPQIFQGNMG